VKTGERKQSCLEKQHRMHAVLPEQRYSIL